MAKVRFQKGNPGGPGHPRNADILAALLKASAAKDPLLALLEEIKNRPEGPLSLADWVRINVALVPYFHPKPTPPLEPSPPFEAPDLKRAADALALFADITKRVTTGALDLNTASTLKSLAEGFLAALNLTEVEDKIAALQSERGG